MRTCCCISSMPVGPILASRLQLWTRLQIGAGDVPRLMVLNKSDRVEPEVMDRLLEQFTDSVAISAVRSEGLEDLLEAVAQKLAATQAVGDFEIPYDRGEVRSALHDQGEVLEETAGEAGFKLVVKAPRAVISRYAKFAREPDEPSETAAR